MKELLSSEDFYISDLIDSNRVMQRTWQTGVANAKLEFSGEARVSDFFTKIAVRKH